MNTRTLLIVAAALSLLPTVSLADAGKVSHALVREVMTRHDATPGNAGLFTVLWEEANILAAHAALAAERPGDLTWMQQHARHVRHTLDPNLEPGGGPGLGYGVIPAARAVLGRMQQLKALPDASSLVKVDADRVRIAAENTLTRATELLMLSVKILEATLPEQAARRDPARDRAAPGTGHRRIPRSCVGPPITACRVDRDPERTRCRRRG